MKTTKLRLATGLTYSIDEWDGPASTIFCLVHGFSDLGAGWDELAPLLAPHGRVIAPDLRGHGDSDRIGAGGYYHFFDYVADLDSVIDQLVPAAARLVLVGHSMGGSVCGYYAGVRPQRIASLVLIEGLGPPDGMYGDGPARTASWIDAWRKTRAAWKPIELAEAVRRLMKNDNLLTEPVARRLAERGTRREPDGLVTWKHDPLHLTIGPYPFRLDALAAHWAKITCPVLVVDGAKTQLNLSIPEREKRRALIPNCHHAEVPDAGHAVQRHQPAALAQLILQGPASR